MATPDPAVCVPMQLSAYVLNPTVCKPPPASTIAPITQPNYTFLRLSDSLLTPDILPPHDLHAASSPSTNSRITDLGTGALRTNRIGVYLHWSLPRLYRTGLSSTTSDPTSEIPRRSASGLPPLPASNPDAHTPQFRTTPNRFLITRRIHPPSILPATAAPLIPEFTSWIVESDALSNIQTLPLSTDLEVEVSPYIDGTLDTLDSQAELFIGGVYPAAGWRERGNTPNTPRVTVSVLNSSNQLFADYVPHCGNVFSMLDRFEYLDAAGVRRVLTDATASYSVVGWHSPDRLQDDPLFISPQAPITRAARLSALSMAFSPSSSTPPQWLTATTSARTLCHGSLYDVLFSSDSALPTPADGVAALLHSASPVALGTTPTNALLAFVDAHSSEDKTLADLKRIQELLIRGEETADAQYEASDMLSAHNFAPCPDSGSQWHLSGSPGGGGGTGGTTTTTPSIEVQQKLADLNATQSALDTAQRALKAQQYQLWAIWWTYLTTPHPDAAMKSAIKAVVGGISDGITKLQAQVDAWGKEVGVLAQGLNVERGAGERYWTLRDPTVLLGGLRSAWPADWMENVRVRLDNQLVVQGGGTDSGGGWQVDGFSGTIVGGLPTDVQGAVKGLLREFAQVRPRATPTADATAISGGGVLPLYYDPNPGATERRDLWGGKQPWFPLFIEWELEYTHVPFDLWTFAPTTVAGAPPRMRWGVKAGENLQGLEKKDSQRASGRVLILPQAGFSLGASIQQLFESTAPAVLASVGYADKSAQEELLREVAELPFLSAPLTGLTEHLTTRLRGTHIKPSRRVPGAGLTPLPTALIEAIGISAGQIGQMGAETALVPYAFHVDAAEGRPALFKPAMHGQVRFTRLDVLDRWGQCVSAVDPRPALETPPLYPVVGEYYRPQLLDGGGPNTVGVVPEPPGHCQYSQTPPNINQDARLNSHFLVRDNSGAGAGGAGPWRPATEWESPMWGWLVVNYAEEGLQFFLPNGTFYREVRLGGVFGATEPPPWRPFPPPDSLTASATSQLDRLLAKLKDDAVYLRAFVSTVNAATTSVAHPPNEYADYMASITGRPLALVNIGYSLELAVPPLTNQSRRSTNPPTKQLLDYEFKVKLGDVDRSYDGLVGYFPGAPNPTDDTGPPPGAECDVTRLYTYFPRTANDPGTVVTNNIGPEDYLPLKPYYVDPTIPGADPVQLRRKHNKELKVVSCVVDPFTAVHLYSGILPIVPLLLPQWSVQSALKVMTAFFGVGPVVVAVRDLLERAGRSGTVGGEKDYVAGLPEMGTAMPGTGMPIPAAVGEGEWVWLQPVRVPGAAARGSGGGVGAAAGGGVTAATGDTGVTMFSPLGVEKVDVKARFEDGPYTAVEGYLQLRKALV